MKKQLRSIFNKPLLLRQSAVEEISAIALSENFSISQSEIDEIDSELIQRVEGKTGIIEINGVICRKGSWLSLIFGECPINLLQAAIQQFLDKPSITRILLLIDSPGGFTDGVNELSNFIYESRSQKEIVALADSMACSAAYWIGSAASKFYLSSSISEVGSIGVYRMHQDISGALDKSGIKVTEISSGKYKTLGSPYKPLDKESIELLGESVFYTHDLFVETVRRNRGLSEEEAKAISDGRVYFGSKAINLKLVDGIMSEKEIKTRKDLMASAMSEDEEEKAEAEEEKEKAESEDDEEEKAETEELEEEEETALWKKNPSLCKKIFRQGLKAGTKKERVRIREIEEMTNEGFEKDAFAYKFENGKSSNEFAAFQLKAMKARGGLSPQALRETRTQKVPFAPPPANEKPDAEAEAFREQMVAVAGNIGKQLVEDKSFKLN